MKICNQDTQNTNRNQQNITPGATEGSDLIDFLIKQYDRYRYCFIVIITLIKQNVDVQLSAYDAFLE
jgi:hypothetical protein